MSIDTHKTLARRWFGEIVNSQTDPATLLAALDATFAPEFVDHDGPEPQHGRAALQRALPLLLTACPDARLTIEQLFGEGDRVAVRVRGEATHSAMIMGIPPTGRRITWTENELFRFEHGQIVESWGEGTLDTALATIGLSFKSAPRPANAGDDEYATIAQEVLE
jgi:predicted ester cyclase